MIKIHHKKSDCIGCTACTEFCPTYWYMDEEGLASLYTVEEENDRFQYGSGFEDDLAALKKAEKCCPVKIIRIEK